MLLGFTIGRDIIMVTVYLTRHGQTVWNLDKRLQGSGNSDLTDHGIEQAEQLKKRVDSLQLDVIRK